ncbi:hypothetical protein [Oceanobacillus sp. CFH 90083]|uniref:hypothetical protein n=1 Tax=Oceanobacillus sp. CFH 90083 TaxID=2592336 RepID=UPI00128D66CF|nr:hypothetical protein [Oceanobacillus sp. CFH 90083]
MKNDEKTQIEQNRKKFSIKSMYFNRYLLVRYVSALFFFTNLYWMISLLISDSSLYVIPLILMAGLLFSIAEQVKIYSNHTNNAKYTKYSYLMLLITNLILIIPTCFSSSFTQLFPFLLNQEKSKILVLIILVAGILLSALILYRLNQIKHNEDKHYERIKNYEKAVN